MAEAGSSFLVIDHPPRGSGFEIALWGRLSGRLFAVACRPTHAEAVREAAAEAERRGGLAVDDRTGEAA